MKKIIPEHLIAMDAYTKSHPLKIHVAYARDDNTLFGQRIYRQDAQLWLHKDLASIVLRAVEICQQRHNHSFILYDGLRTIEAQAAMLKTQRVQDNPHWLEEPRLLSPPGAGGHPRGMAIDIALLDAQGTLIDMGTEFDYLANDASPDHNPAHRNYTGLTDAVVQNRVMLDQSMADAASELNLPLLPLPEEWWDFRLPANIANQYEPLSDAMLPPQMQMMD